MISFEGSVNETQRGWLDNVETLVTFSSWEQPDYVTDSKISKHCGS